MTTSRRFLHCMVAASVVLGMTAGLAACAEGSEASRVHHGGGPPVSASTVSVKHNAPPRFHVVHGTWQQPPVTPENIQPHGPDEISFDATSGTSWSGDLTGTTTFTMHGIANTTSLAGRGTIQETFTGALGGVGSGTLSFVEAFAETETGTITIYATVVSGTGSLRSLRGALRFTGQVDASGTGTGTYDGALMG